MKKTIITISSILGIALIGILTFVLVTKPVNLDKEVDKIEITFAEGDSAASVKSDFNVPVELKKNKKVDFVWSSSNDDIVKFEKSKGIVTRVDEDKDITISVHLVLKDKKSKTKEFKIVVVSLDPDFSVLETKLETFKETLKTNKESDKYTEESIKEAEALVSKAEGILADETATHSDIAKMIGELETFQYVSKEKEEILAKKEELKKAIKKLQDSLDDEVYTKESIEAAKSVIAAAEKVLSKDNVKVSELDAEITKVESVKLISKEIAKLREDLKSKIDAFSKEVAKDDVYTKESIASAKLILAAANSVYENEESSKEALSAQIEAITAFKFVKLVDVAKNNLKDEYIKFEGKIDPNVHTPSNVKLAKDLVEKAKDLVTNEKATLKEINDLIEEIKNFEFVKQANFAKLSEAIKVLEAKIESGNYTEESVKAAEVVVKAAKDLLNNKESTQKEVDDMVLELESVKLVEKPVIDEELEQAKADLEESIETLEGKIDEELHTEESVAAAKELIAAAKALLENEEATKEMLLAKKAELDAFELVEKPVIDELEIEKNKLRLEITRLEGLIEEGNLTETTINMLRDNLKEARALLVNDKVTIEQLKAMISKLQSLELVTLLEEALSNLKLTLEEFTTKIDEKIHTPATVEAFEGLVDRVELALNNEGITLEQVNELLAEIQGFEFKLIANNSKLVDAILILAGRLNPDVYTKESIDLANELIAEAKLLSEDLNATQDQLDNMVEKLTNFKLVEKEINDVENAIKVLNSLIKQLEEQIDEELYTPASIKEVKDLIVEAKKIVDKESVELDELTVMISKLKEFNFVIIADFTELEKIINETQEKLESGIYTEESVASALIVLEAAKEVFNNKNSTKDEIKVEIDKLNSLNLITKLSVAIENLKSKIANLEKLINEDEQTPNSVEAAKNLITRAEELLKLENIKLEDVEKLIQDFNEFVLIEQASFEKLLESINILEKEINSGLYTDESVKTARKVLEDAKLILNNKNSTQDQVDEARTKVESVELVKKDGEDLEDEIKELQNQLNENNQKYTKESVNKLQDLINNITKLISKEELTDEEEKELAKLTKELHEFNLVELNMELIEAKLEKLESELAKDIYTADSINEAKERFSELLETDLTSLNTYEMKNTYLESVEAVISSLVKKNVYNGVDLNQIIETIDYANDLIGEVQADKSNVYTKLSIEMYQELISQAIALVEKVKDPSSDVKQKDVDKLNTNIRTFKFVELTKDEITKLLVSIENLLDDNKLTDEYIIEVNKFIDKKKTEMDKLKDEVNALNQFYNEVYDKKVEIEAKLAEVTIVELEKVLEEAKKTIAEKELSNKYPSYLIEKYQTLITVGEGYINEIPSEQKVIDALIKKIREFEFVELTEKLVKDLIEELKSLDKSLYENYDEIITKVNQIENDLAKENPISLDAAYKMLKKLNLVEKTKDQVSFERELKELSLMTEEKEQYLTNVQADQFGKYTEESINKLQKVINEINGKKYNTDFKEALKEVKVLKEKLLKASVLEEKIEEENK